jgi:hypothetical protein
MNKNQKFSFLFIVPFLICPLVIYMYFGNIKQTVITKPMTIETTPPQNAITVLPSPTPTFAPFSAFFTIYVNGVKRDFSQAMYVEASTSAFIPKTNTASVVVNSPSTTWDSFFKTLPPPFSVKKDCLVTGLGEQFCGGKNKFNVPEFYLNGKKVDTDILQSAIKLDDKLVIWIHTAGVKPTIQSL